MKLTVHVNGASYTREIEPRLLLIHFLRDELRLTGSHWGCDTSNCGACVVWLDETPVKSCTVLAAMADGHRVRTVEGLAHNGELDPVQQGFAQCHGLQCGFCTPGMMLTARWLLDRNPDPSAAEIREALSGQTCRCTGYENIVRSVIWASKHSASKRSVSKRSVSKPSVSKPSVSKPSVSKPSASKPSASGPTPSGPSASKHSASGHGATGRPPAGDDDAAPGVPG
jgi:carbon-monoxide dehydrogenase small subunit